MGGCDYWFFEDKFERLGLREEIKKYAQNILDKDYQIVGFSLYTSNILFSVKLTAALKKANPELFIIFGGPACWFLHNHPQMPIQYMVSPKMSKSLIEPGVVDVFVRGEGEEAAERLIVSYFDGCKDKVPGTVVYSQGKYIIQEPPQLVGNLDKLPYPAWDKLSLSVYREEIGLPILFSRGCINRCAFCIDWKIWQEKYRFRSAENIFQEMKEVVEKYKINVFVSNDLLFNARLDVIENLADLIINSGLKISWNVQGLIRADMEFSLLKKMQVSGLERVTYGVESLSDNVLRAMKKPYSFSDIQKVLKNSKKAGIVTAFNLIVGFPTESENDFIQTKERLALLKDDIDMIAGLQACGLLGGSDIYVNSEKYSILPGLKNNDWKSLGGSNNLETRRRRVNELFDFAQKLGLKIEFKGIPVSSS
jgi:anaerobic magnesium-protoporphyrin IX monomethyl ester cyclase